MTKLNPQTMKNQYDHQYDTFCRKNHDYGNSFEESLDQFGIVASIVRMSDKMKRLESLTDETKTQQVGSESLLDTLEDLSNYAAMTACWLKGVGAEDEVVEKEPSPDTIDAYKYAAMEGYNDIEKKIDVLLQKLFKMTENKKDGIQKDVWFSIIDEISFIAKNNKISDSHLMDLIYPYTRLESKTILYQVNRKKSSHEDTVYKNNVPVMTIHNSNDNDGRNKLSETVEDVISMLKKVDAFHHKIEEFKMTEDDHKKLDSITTRLRSKVTDGSISEELMKTLIILYVKMNPDVMLFQLLNRTENIHARPTEVPEAIEKYFEANKQQIDYMLANGNPQKISMDILKEILGELYVTIFEYLDRQKEIYNNLAKIILHGLVDFKTVARIVNDFSELNRDEKKYILECIVAAAYEIDSKNFPGMDPNSEFLKKKFHIPDEIMEDLKNLEEEKPGIGDKILKAIIWLLPLNKDY